MPLRLPHGSTLRARCSLFFSLFSVAPSARLCKYTPLRPLFLCLLFTSCHKKRTTTTFTFSHAAPTQRKLDYQAFNKIQRPYWLPTIPPLSRSAHACVRARCSGRVCACAYCWLEAHNDEKNKLSRKEEDTGSNCFAAVVLGFLDWLYFFGATANATPSADFWLVYTSTFTNKRNETFNFSFWFLNFIQLGFF